VAHPSVALPRATRDAWLEFFLGRVAARGRGATSSSSRKLRASLAANERERISLPRSNAERSPSGIASWWRRSTAMLTTREREVLRLLARGYAYKEISSRLSISIKTVESHASAVLRKLQLSNRRELSRWAAEHKLG
jgi:DNA-binding NarL/FixJ family response regulator